MNVPVDCAVMLIIGLPSTSLSGSIDSIRAVIDNPIASVKLSSQVYDVPTVNAIAPLLYGPDRVIVALLTPDRSSCAPLLVKFVTFGKIIFI